jgi:hypothetical protein
MYDMKKYQNVSILPYCTTLQGQQHRLLSRPGVVSELPATLSFPLRSLCTVTVE